MSRRKSFIKTISIVLSLLILLTALPLGVSAADTAEVTTDVKVEDVTSENMSFAGARVRAEEGDGLNTIVINNGDGTHTMTLYNHPVKYVDEKGEVQDISLEIASATDGSYKTKANDIQTVFPKKISDGISISGKGVSVKLTPSVQPPLVREVAAQPSEGVRNDEGVVPYDSLPLEGKVSPQVTDEVSTVTRLDNETVSYYYDSNTTLEYSLTYTGFKEDIVVSEYTGQTEYHFLLETGGLTLTKIDESYYLADENGEVKATLGDIIIFTADERNNALGSMTHVTVRENQQYIITIHVDAEYLKDEKTKYPIRIDPTIEITHDNNGSGAIQDVTLNENSGSSGTSGSLYVGKRNTYGISRTLMKFPGLNLGAIPSANNIVSAYVEIRDMLCETTMMTVYGCAFEGSVWSDSTVEWGNANPERYLDLQNSYANVSYSNGNAKNPKHRYSIDITEAIRYWKMGSVVYTKDTGIMLKASYEVENGSSAFYKTFASYNRASNKPSLTLNYTGSTAPPAAAATIGINDYEYDYIPITDNTSLNAECGLEDYGYNVVWSGNSTEITVNSSTGAINNKDAEGNAKSGIVTITATATNGSDTKTITKTCTLYKPSLGITDQEYYHIMGISGNKSLATSGTTIYGGAISTTTADDWRFVEYDDGEYILTNRQSSKVLYVNGNTLAMATSTSSSYRFAVYRIDSGNKQGLFVIRYNEYYVAVSSAGSVYLTTSASNDVYWSLMATQKQSSKYYSIIHPDTQSAVSMVNNVMSSKGYSASQQHCVTAYDAYNQLKDGTNDVLTYVCHGMEDDYYSYAAIDFQNTDGTSNGRIAATQISSQETNYYYVDELTDNALSNVRCALLLGCKTGQTYEASDLKPNLVKAYYDAGAHFALGTNDILYYDEEVVPFLQGFTTALSQNKNINECVAAGVAQIRTYLSSAEFTNNTTNVNRSALLERIAKDVQGTTGGRYYDNFFICYGDGYQYIH